MNRLREISERLTAIAAELGAEGADDARAAELAARPPSSPPRRSRRRTGAYARARPRRSERVRTPVVIRKRTLLIYFPSTRA